MGTAGVREDRGDGCGHEESGALGRGRCAAMADVEWEMGPKNSKSELPTEVADAGFGAVSQISAVDTHSTKDCTEETDTPA